MLMAYPSNDSCIVSEIIQSYTHGSCRIHESGYVDLLSLSTQIVFLAIRQAKFIRYHL